MNALRREFGWLLLVALLVGGYYLYQHYRRESNPATHHNRCVEHTAKHEWTEAEQAATRALEIGYPERHAEVLALRGQARVELGRFHEGLDDCNQAVLADPNNVEAWMTRGNAQAALGANNGAVHDFTKATEVDPLSAPAWASLGMQFIKMGEVSQGELCLAKARKIDPTILMKAIAGKMAEANR